MKPFEVQSRHLPIGLTRRGFLVHVAAAGGGSLVYEAMTGLGLLAAPTQVSFGLRERVSGVRVVILGAGLAGMTVAYELGKVGYDCRVIEARVRPGGRVFTVRRGTVSDEDGPRPTAAFDDGLYFNAGPMRISHHHHTTLAYCRELQVPLEVFVPDCETAYIVPAKGPLAGRRLRRREAAADFDGYIAELLSKALSQAQLDRPLTAEVGNRPASGVRVGSQATPISVVQTFPSWDAWAQEVSDSRIYGGVHFRFSNEAGEEIGRRAARMVQRALQPLSGRSHPRD